MDDYGSSSEGWREVVLLCNTKAEAQPRDSENVLCVEPNPLSVYTRGQKAECRRPRAVVAQVSASWDIIGFRNPLYCCIVVLLNDIAEFRGIEGFPVEMSVRMRGGLESAGGRIA